MLFDLRDIPTQQVLKELAKKFNIDVTASETILKFARTGSDVLVALNSYHARNQLSLSKFAILINLYRREDGLMPSELAEMMGNSRGTISGLLDGLGRDQFIERIHSQSDKRMVIVKITENGVALLEGILPDYFKRVGDMMSLLTEEERAQMGYLLQKISLGISLFNKE